MLLQTFILLASGLYFCNALTAISSSRLKILVGWVSALGEWAMCTLPNVPIRCWILIGYDFRAFVRCRQVASPPIREAGHRASATLHLLGLGVGHGTASHIAFNAIPPKVQRRKGQVGSGQSVGPYPNAGFKRPWRWSPQARSKRLDILWYICHITAWPAETRRALPPPGP